MRLLALAVMLAVGCAQDPESRFPDPSALYSLTASDVTCDGASSVSGLPESGPPYTTIFCTWTCTSVGGRAVRSVGLTFRRDDASSTWRETFAAWDFGVCG